MLFVSKIKKSKRLKIKKVSEKSNSIIKIINEKRSDIPAITHVDYSARVQTVNKNDHPDFYNIINSFYKLTGCPVLINTSFNVRGMPIVCDPQDAFKFLK